MGQFAPPIEKKNQLLGEVNGEMTVDEDIKLVLVWLNVSLDVVTSTKNTQHFGIEFGSTFTMTRNLTALSIL